MRRPAIVRPSAVLLFASLLGCGSGDPSGTNPPPPPPPNGPPSAPIAALDDAAARIAPALGGCSDRVTTELTTLRLAMAPFLNATRADVERVRTALTGCTDPGALADRDAVGLALDVAVDMLAAAGR